MMIRQEIADMDFDQMATAAFSMVSYVQGCQTSSLLLIFDETLSY